MPPAVVAADYTPAIIEGKPAITATSLATLRLEAEKQRNKEVRQLKPYHAEVLRYSLGVFVYRVKGGSDLV